MRVWFLVALLLLVAADGGLSAADTRADSVAAHERQRQELRRRIAALQQKLELTRSEKDNLSAELGGLEKQIGVMLANLKQLDERRGKLEKQRQRLQQQLQVQQGRLEEGKQVLGRLIRSAWINGREERLKLFLNQQDPALISRILTYHDYFTRTRTRKLQELHEFIVSVDRLAMQIERQQKELGTLQQQYRQEQRQLAERQRERQALLKRLETRLREQGEQLTRWQEDELHLAGLIEQIQVVVATLEMPEQEDFGARKGRLIWPLAGRLANRFGAEKIGNLRWDGVIIEAREGTEVRAVHAGRVAYADWLRGYGLLIIIEHGGGFMTLYGHNQSLFKEVGDWVAEKEVIGLAGNSGGSTTAGVYFGVRYQGKARNPLHWCRKPRGKRVG